MSALYFVVSVMQRKSMAGFMKAYEANSVKVNFVAFGKGTAQNETLDLLGLDSTEKAVCFSVMTQEVWSSFKKSLRKSVRIDAPGVGISFSVPLSSIGGMRELLFLTDGMHYQPEEESKLKETRQALLIAICEQGYSEQVMEAARAGGAGGGTVIHAKGTGMKQAEKFFGITLSSEKDLILIVAKTEDKNAIMSGIMQHAGVQTKAKAVVFSVPVTDTAGLRLFED